MKNLFLILFLLTMYSTGYAQYNDTLYYKSGNVKAVTVRQHDEKFLHYEYRGKNGKLVDNKIALSILKYFVIYDEYGKLVYNSANPKKKEENTVPESAPHQE